MQAELAADLQDIENAVTGVEGVSLSLPIADAAVDTIVQATIAAMTREIDVAS